MPNAHPTGSKEYYDALGEALHKPLAAFVKAAGERGRQPYDARAFIQFKFYGALTGGRWLRDHFTRGEASIKKSGETVHLRVGLFFLVDSFLFQAAAVRDALLQLANAGFAMGIPLADTRLDRKVGTYLNVTKTSSTGLEKWLTDQPLWLSQLLWLRKESTHRGILHMPEAAHHFGVDEAGESVWEMYRVELEHENGASESLRVFLDRTERELATLLPVSLEALHVHLTKLHPSP